MPPDARRGGIGAAIAAAEADSRRSMMRNHGGGHAPVSYLELFFDLVFVFAITQLSHGLLHHLSWLGLAEMAILFLAVWWAWIYTAWTTNWLDPGRFWVRLMLLAIMLLALVMAVAIPEAFGAEGLYFAAAYVAIQLGRTTGMALLMRGEGSTRIRNAVRIAVWFAVSAVFWITGGLSDQVGQRLALWLVALGIEYIGPAAMFWVPGFGRSKGSDWDISGSHMAERCALFIIIALGEGIVVTGSSLAGQPLTDARLTGFIVAFLSAALMWWLYFDLGAERGSRLIAGHSQAGRVARNAYTYLHMPIVLGIVIAAVGDGLLLERAPGVAGAALVAVQTGGMALFLAGVGLFKRFAAPFGNFPMSHIVALVLVALLGAAGLSLAIGAIEFAGWGVVILVLTCLWEWVSFHGGWTEPLQAVGVPIPAWVLRRAKRLQARRAQSDIT